ncbi:hypothetical protein CSPX01_04723 [Colletotrichum filicis]|nr:hypothetical protein CSPX01_04723 [Colletotrichum filicis]
MPLALVARETRPCMHACITNPHPHRNAPLHTNTPFRFPSSLSSPSPCLAFQQCSNPPARVITLYRTWLKHNTLGPSPLSDIFDMQGQAAASHAHGLKTQRNKKKKRGREA